MHPAQYIKHPGKDKTPPGVEPLTLYAVVKQQNHLAGARYFHDWISLERWLRAIMPHNFPVALHLAVHFGEVDFEFEPMILADADACQDLEDTCTDWAKFKCGRAIPLSATTEAIVILRAPTVDERAKWVWYLQLQNEYHLTKALKN